VQLILLISVWFGREFDISNVFVPTLVDNVDICVMLISYCYSVLFSLLGCISKALGDVLSACLYSSWSFHIQHYRHLLQHSYLPDSTPIPYKLMYMEGGK
jgi:hypothetical protein